MTRKRPSGLIYKNSKRVELLDAETLEPVDTFVNATTFARHFKIEVHRVSTYLTNVKKRCRIRGYCAQYEGDDFWIKKKQKEQERKIDKTIKNEKLQVDNYLNYLNKKKPKTVLEKLIEEKGLR